MKPHFSIFFPICLLIGILSSLLSCRKENSYIKDEGLVWNTAYHITYKSDENFHDSIVELFEKVSKSLSIFDAASIVSQVNKQDTTEIDERFKTVYETSLKINEISGGVFDPTVSPLVTAWGFGPRHTPTADTVAIDSLLQFVGITKTRIIDNYLIKDDIRTQFNFSAIAKGYGCDEVAAFFMRHDINDFMIEIGGEINLHGQSPSGTKWKISIDAPLEEEEISHNSFLIVELSDCGMATSGNYRNYYQKDGEKLGHTISPLTGRPVTTDILSATVISQDAMISDALATACMAASAENALQMLGAMNAEGLLILTDSVVMTPGFDRFIAK